MKKFITVVPLQKDGQLKKYVYRAMGNSRLQLDTAVSFPILTAMHGYLEPGERSKLVALWQDTEDGRRNLRILREQMEEVCAKRNLALPELDSVKIGMEDTVSTHADNFRKLIDRVEDDDELFACITFGTKPASQTVLMAVQYAYRIKRNASISGAECGCQAEVGSACSMAAAGLAELYHMELDQIEYAAEVAMEHHLGLTCDPICGLVQIPCIERNAVAAMRAINALSLANFLTYTRKISFDMVVKTMYETGRDLFSKYRETSEGGLAKMYRE